MNAHLQVGCRVKPGDSVIDKYQQCLAELISKRGIETLDNPSQLRGLLADYLPHPAYRRSLVLAVECGIVGAIRELTPKSVLLGRAKFVKRLDTHGVRLNDAQWTVDTLLAVVAPHLNPDTSIGMITLDESGSLNKTTDFEYAYPRNWPTQLEKIERAKLDRVLSPEKYIEEDEKSKVNNIIIQVLKDLDGLSDNERTPFRGFTEACRSILALDYLDETLGFIFPKAYGEHANMSSDVLMNMKRIRTLISEMRDTAKCSATIHQMDRLLSVLPDTPSERNLGLDSMYKFGKAVEANQEEADEMLQLAASQGELGATLEIAGFYKERGDLATARQWLVKAAERDDAKYIFHHLGEFLINLTEPDLAEAIRYFEIGLRRGDEYCIFNLALLYEEGKGVQKDLNKARELWEKFYWELGLDSDSIDVALYKALDLGSIELKSHADELDQRDLDYFAKLYETGKDEDGIVIPPDPKLAQELREKLARLAAEDDGPSSG